MKKQTQIRATTKHVDELKETAEESDKDWDGARAESGMIGSVWSGFLVGFEGIVGIEDPAEGEGNKGVISGETTWGMLLLDEGGSDMADEASNLLLWCTNKHSKGEAIKAAMITTTKSKQPIELCVVMIVKSIAHAILEVRPCLL